MQSALPDPDDLSEVAQSEASPSEEGQSVSMDAGEIVRRATLAIRLAQVPDPLEDDSPAAAMQPPRASEPGHISGHISRATAPSAARVSTASSRRRAPRPQRFLTPARGIELVLGIVVIVLAVRLARTPTAQVAPAPSEYLTASARWMLVLTGQRIDEFRRTNYRLPEDLGELGPGAPEGIEYVRYSSEHYRLTARPPGEPLWLDSYTPRAQFLGKSINVLLATATP